MTGVGPVGGLVLAVRLALELAALATLGYAGWTVPGALLARVVLAVGLPVVAAVVWGRWVAPRAPRRLPDPAKLGVALAVFTAATAGLLLAGHQGLAVGLATTYVIDVAAIFALRLREL